MCAVRLHDRPIFTPDLHPSIGRNIPGPSAIRVPDWTAHWLGITISISPITRAATQRLRRPQRLDLRPSRRELGGFAGIADSWRILIAGFVHYWGRPRRHNCRAPGTGDKNVRQRLPPMTAKRSLPEIQSIAATAPRINKTITSPGRNRTYGSVRKAVIRSRQRRQCR